MPYYREKKPGKATAGAAGEKKVTPKKAAPPKPETEKKASPAKPAAAKTTTKKKLPAVPESYLKSRKRRDFAKKAQLKAALRVSLP